MAKCYLKYLILKISQLKLNKTVFEKIEGGSDEPGDGIGLPEVMKSGCVLANTGMAQVLAITWVPILAKHLCQSMKMTKL